MRHRSPAPRRAARHDAPAPRPLSAWVVATASVVSLAAVAVVGIVYGPREPSTGASRPAIPTAVTPSNTPSPPPPLSPVSLDGTGFDAPAGWDVSSSTLTDSTAVVARLTHLESGSRVQAATLVEPQDPMSACEALAEAYAGQFTSVGWDLTLPIGVDQTLGTAATCGFRGTPPEQEPVRVTYTLVERHLDGRTLLWRTTHGQGAAGVEAATAEATAMVCQASTEFGVPLPLC